MLHKNLNSELELEWWGGMLCGYFGIAISILTLIIEVNTGSLYSKIRKKHEQQNENCLCLHCSNLLLFELLIFELAHSHMSFQKCSNLAP